MLMIESAPVPVAVPSQQLILHTSIPAAQPAFTPAAEPSILDQLCVVFARLTIQCAHTPLALVQAGSSDVPQQFGRPTHDLQPAALTLAPRLFGVPSLVNPSVTAPAVATQHEDMEIVPGPVLPVGQLPLPAGQLPFPPMAPITIPALAVSTPVAQPVRNQAVVDLTGSPVIKQLPKSDLAVPKRRSQQPSSSVQPQAAQIRRNTPAGPVNLVIENPAPAAMISRPQQPVPATAPQQQQQQKQKQLAPAQASKSKPPLSRAIWKPVVRLSSAEAQARLTLPKLPAPAPAAPVVPVPVTPAVVPAVAPAPTPVVIAAPVAPTFVFATPAPAPRPAAPTTGPVIPPNGSRPLATMRRRRAFGNTVPPPPDASVLGPLRQSDQHDDRRPSPNDWDDGDAVPEFLPIAESSTAQQSSSDPAPKPSWTGKELRTLVDQLINECVYFDTWRRVLNANVGGCIAYEGEDDDDDTLDSEEAAKSVENLFRSVRKSQEGTDLLRDNVLRKVVRIARRNGLFFQPDSIP
ncbi:hypothetical protein QBC40DRAFT_162480 [Triangularia verruculosa]|uniref:Uncharacterized protein n=1 Tax=Triangularia verruculosa TaxID=2587418 RepID=A0AAN6XTI8_9PEZI|nr:hypothetical protein QBC40DRAFT_162480 [Triangularia verruculosa]